MFFKKKKISPASSKPKKTVYFIASLGVLGIFFLASIAVSAVNNINFKVFDFTETTSTGATIGPSETTIVYDEQGDIEKNIVDKDTTYILLTGRGGGDHDAPDLTDTIILLGVHNQNQSISLLSIPRDLYVNYPESTRRGKINRIYETFLPSSSELGMERLKSKVTEITGKYIDYYVNIDFEGFKEVVDALGGVEVTLENNFVDYEFPDENNGYRSFILRKGTWTLDGDVALMYARSRHSTSDFDRSLRQQQIISSLREKVSKLGYFKDRKKISDLYGIFRDYVETDMGITDMISLGLTLKGWDSTTTTSFNLNDSCYSGSPICERGGLLYVPLREYFGGASVLLPNTGTSIDLDDYSEIRDYSNLIFSFPEIFTDPKNIVIYNNTSISLYAASLAEILRPYGFSIDSETGTQTLKEKIFENSILYYNGIESDDSTLQALKKYINIPQVQVDGVQFSNEDVRIEIILANDNSF